MSNLKLTKALKAFTLRATAKSQIREEKKWRENALLSGVAVPKSNSEHRNAVREQLEDNLEKINNASSEKDLIKVNSGKSKILRETKKKKKEKS